MWKLLAGAGAVALIGFALWLGITKYGAARFDEGRLSVASEINSAAVKAEQEKLKAFERGIAQGQQASLGFVQWREGPLRTIIERTKHDNIVFRESVAGRVQCLDADGVRAANQGITAINATAFPADSSGPAPTVPDRGPDQPEPRRDGDGGADARTVFPNRPEPRGVRAEAEAGGGRMAEVTGLFEGE